MGDAVALRPVRLAAAVDAAADHPEPVLALGREPAVDAHLARVLAAVAADRVRPPAPLDRARADDAALALSLLKRLPEAQREILILRVAVGMSTEETALAIGMSPGAVRVAQHRALARLRTMLVQLEAGEVA